MLQAPMFFWIMLILIKFAVTAFFRNITFVIPGTSDFAFSLAFAVACLFADVQ